MEAVGMSFFQEFGPASADAVALANGLHETIVRRSAEFICNRFEGLLAFPAAYFAGSAGALALAFAISGSFSALRASFPCLLSGS